MAFQIINDGACIRIENGTKTLLVTKDQVKTIDTIQNNIVRIDIGEGALRNIFINYQDVTAPAVGSGNELRDLINEMLLSDQYDGSDAKEATQLAILQEVQNLKVTTASLLQNTAKVDITKLEPIFVDESNPNMIFKGWAQSSASASSPSWAIERISRTNDIIVHEWADGDQAYDNIWDNRIAINYSPYLSNPVIR